MGKQLKFFAFSLIPLLLITIISFFNLYDSFSANDKLSIQEKKLTNSINSNRFEGIKDYFTILDMIEEKGKINIDHYDNSLTSFIISYNSLDSYISSSKHSLSLLKGIYNDDNNSGLSNKNYGLILNYKKKLNTPVINILPSKTYNNVYNVIGTDDFQGYLNKINNFRNNIIVSFRKGNYEAYDFKKLENYVNSEIRDFSDAQNLISKEMFVILKEKKSNIFLMMIIYGFVGILSLVLLVLNIKTHDFKPQKQLTLLENFNPILKKLGFETIETLDADNLFLLEDKFAGISQNIDILRDNEVKALNASKSKSAFLANMSHEIRTPLNGIVGFLSFLKESNEYLLNDIVSIFENKELSTDNKSKELDKVISELKAKDAEKIDFINIIENSSDELLKIINDILDFSKIESDKVELDDANFNPIEEFEKAIEVYSPKASEKHIDLGFYIDPSLDESVKGDFSKVREVLINLISNAVKFTPEGKEVFIEIKKVPSIDMDKIAVEFAVNDTGIGIAEDKQKSIFEAFAQADSSTTREFGGTGLGLNISYKYIELMGGELQIKSQVNEGSTFYFTLNFEKNSTAKVKGSEKDIFRNLSVAIYESKNTLHTNIEKYSEYYGFQVVNFNTFEDLEHISSNNMADVLLIDLSQFSEKSISDLQTRIESGIINLPIFLLCKFSHKGYIQNLKERGLGYENYYLEPINASKLSNLLHNAKKHIRTKPKDIQQVTTDTEVIDDSSTIGDIPTISTEVSPDREFRILVAEDNVINQRLIRKTLEKFDFHVEIVNDGVEAVEARKASSSFDLIFMDINMPNMNGVEATKTIIEWENSENIKHVPIVALTANAVKGDRDNFMREGLDEYTTKPLNQDEIIDILVKLIPDYNR